jgi:Dyp-type peroxidase family
MAPLSVRMDLGDIQGDILRAYGNDYDCTSYAFVKIECPPEQARAWFAGVVDHVTTAEPWPKGEKPLTTLNVSVTADGLRALGVSKGVVESFSHEFLEGMSSRSRLLGDVGPSDPSTWETGLGTGDAHVLLTINAQTTADHQRALGKMTAAMDAAGGLRIVYQEDTELLPGAREHFGYADGFAQPAIEGTSDDKARGGGVPLKGGGWRALAPGEFILGYPDEDTRVDPKRRLPNAPAAPLGKSGTYMVWRKLYQDVALWRRVIADAAKLYEDGDEHKLSAKVVGRWTNGAPLVKHPDTAPDEFDPKTAGGNDFRYDGDIDGMRCPIGAHIRRSNPRDALGAVKTPKGVADFAGHLSFRHRMIRRGMPYGPPLPEGATSDDGTDRGLVFVSFQGSISRQFEGVQVQWLNAGNIFGLGHDKDFILGDPNATGKMTIQGKPPFFLAPQEVFVRTRGGEYLFAPGMTALAALADGTAG